MSNREGQKYVKLRICENVNMKNSKNRKNWEFVQMFIQKYVYVNSENVNMCNIPKMCINC